MRFSVVTVTWNNLDGLKKTFGSIEPQSFPDFEWLVIDGASTDGTREWFETNSPANAILASEPDDGLYDAMNKGIDRATGEYLVFMNAGDSFHNHTVLAEIDRHLERNGPADLLYGDAYEADSAGIYRKRALSHQLYWYSMFTHHQAMLYRRATLGTMRYDLSFRLSADWALTARLLRAGATARRLPLTICTFERGGASQSVANIRVANAEHRRIHRDIIGLPAGVDLVVRNAKIAVNAVRRRLPGLYDAVRGRF